MSLVICEFSGPPPVRTRPEYFYKKYPKLGLDSRPKMRYNSIMEKTETRITARDAILLAIPEVDRARVSGLAHYLTNREGGRPSDGASKAVRIYESGQLEKWEAERIQERNSQHRRECQFGPKYCDRCKEFDGRES